MTDLTITITAPEDDLIAMLGRLENKACEITHVRALDGGGATAETQTTVICGSIGASELGRTWWVQELYTEPGDSTIRRRRSKIAISAVRSVREL